MSDERTVKRKTITVKDRSGNKYNFDAKVTRGYDYTGDYKHMDKIRNLTIWVHYETAPVSTITFIKDKNTGDYHCPPDSFHSGWSFVLEDLVPLHQDIGTRLWRAMEDLFRKYHVASLHGNIGQPPGMYEALGQGKSPTNKRKNEIAKLFWTKMDFTVEGHNIHKEYKKPN